MVKAAIFLCASFIVPAALDLGGAISMGWAQSELQVSPDGAKPRERATDIFGTLRNGLQQQTEVPLRLPSMKLAYKDSNGADYSRY